ncbi:MAG: multiheme c-type cytochrome [Minicystis sp.]
MPGPHRRRLAAAVALNAGCVSCHQQEAAQWRASRHSQSDTNTAYREAFAIEPSPFCRGCHAPEADPAKPPPRSVSDLGVGCVTCHVTEDGFVLAASSHPDTGSAPHPLRRSSRFAGPEACAACHEFRFPEPRPDGDAHFMQTTVREHRRSRTADEPCAACHMPLVRGRRSHAFAEVRDPAWLKDNLQATVARAAGDRLRITLVQPAPGHAFPTGDLFRRLEIGGELRDDAGRVIRREARHLARHFDIIPGAPGRTLTGDDRVFDEPRIVELDLSTTSPAPRSATVSWWVRYQRVATTGVGTNPAGAKIESEVELHSGTLPWQTN